MTSVRMTDESVICAEIQLLVEPAIGTDAPHPLGRVWTFLVNQFGGTTNSLPSTLTQSSATAV
ncbi:hypothetical protein NS206_05805 [Microbacterium testaceum]|nr:hypothetical protein NS206_05805 [Microbacterium testaceum]